jgi:hypothetical protein
MASLCRARLRLRRPTIDDDAIEGGQPPKALASLPIEILVTECPFGSQISPAPWAIAPCVVRAKRGLHGLGEQSHSFGNSPELSMWVCFRSNWHVLTSRPHGLEGPATI